MITARCEDIMNLTKADVPPGAMIWCDPPWHEKMVKFFHTVKYKDTGELSNNRLEDIISQLGEIANPEQPLIVEYSADGFQQVITLLTAKNHKINGVYQMTQSMGRPFVILVFNSDIKIDTTRKGFDIVTDTVQRLGAKIVFDPFAGIGKTARAVDKAGADYVGVEYNRKRYDKLKELEK